ncbi:MAG: hypothetical protein AB8B66_03690 [Rickettsiaceae bacterium]
MERDKVRDFGLYRHIWEGEFLEYSHAKIDMLYIDRGAISASEAWQKRFGSGQLQYNIKLPAEDFDNSEEEEEIEK